MNSIYKFLSLFVIITLFISCSGEPKEVKQTAVQEEHHDENIIELSAEQYKTADIQLGAAEMKALSGTTKVNGMLDLPPQNMVSISSPFAGTVKSTEMLQGMRVRKGQLIAVLQHPDFIEIQQDYLDYKSQLEYLKLEYDRQQELAAEQVNSKKALQKARSEYQSMQAKVSGMRMKLNLMNVNLSALDKGKISSTFNLYTPISGYVIQVNTNIGALANPSDVLFKIADTDHLHAELTVFEKDVPKLKIGQKVRFTLANETKERMATVYLVGREISDERTVQIHCHLDQEDDQLLPGMYLQALVESGSSKVTALPEKSIVEFEGLKYIFVEAEASHFERVAIRTGVTEFGYTQVYFQDNFDWKSKKIVVNGAYDLLSKMSNGEEEGGHAH
ncbi:efflux RND transporter periplasmic adaptor subunit [Pedobacter metabolipauper]|uniref:Cobalt-zinc-cadmium efflux system membrane fusion protein n=1 Tax=Pedobacter metabolipauper TaxID=425513 RepID=A0A4R6SW07_9SPHI|nr:efflux RND transporter periplasmic adaptor subunit [Pedobacter metabolipauper]TDQ08589.1 cobalt-zinc-cadmium efflux system membrane fusion protein [Pedobacter metabolipauper]